MSDPASTGSHADVVVVGAGLVAANLVRQLRLDGFLGSVTVLGDERHVPYDHPPLSKELLSGAMTEDEVGLLSDAERAELDVELAMGVPATALEPTDRNVVLVDGSRLHYQDCVLATGSRARRPAGLPNLEGVLVLRSLAEALELRDALTHASRLLVVGAGFIGLEVAAGAVERGLPVTVVEQQPLPLTRVLGPEAGRIVRDLHVDRGVDLRCGVGVSELIGASTPAGERRRVTAARLTDGSTIAADLVLFGIGAVPNVEWLEGSGLLVDDGVVCDSGGRTGLPGVWAAGDVARWPNEATGLHQRVEQWQSALDQAVIVAHNIARPDGDARWRAVPYFWSDQFGTKIQFCGHPGEESRVLDSPRGPVVGFAAEGRLTGVLAIGQPRLIARGRQLVAKGAGWPELLTLVAG